jgi:glucan phosphoethanolaminetransferase (alkaline phosphatase superfamily)
MFKRDRKTPATQTLPLTPQASPLITPALPWAAQATLALHLVLELSLWLVPAALFMVVYVAWLKQPSVAAWPHMSLVLSGALTFAAWRLVSDGADPEGRTRWWSWGMAGRFFTLALGAGCLAAMLLYYASVVVGLTSWGRVPTWPLLKIYLTQWRGLLDTLNVDATMVMVVAALAATLLLAFFAWTLHRLRWPQSARRRVGRLVAFATLFAAASLFVLRLYELTSGLHRASAEPLSLTLQPAAAGAVVNQNAGTRENDEREARWAESYVPSDLRPKRNVILIVGDALRADRMSLFGHARPTTPNLDRMAARGELAVAHRAVAACSESFCGLMALTRSKHLHESSLRSLSLSNVLQQHGYRYGLILGGDHTNFYGLAQALGPADLYWDGSYAKGYVNDDRLVLARARELPLWDGTPTLLQFHLMSTHALGKRHASPYEPALNYYRGVTLSDNKPEVAASIQNFYDNGMTQFDSMLANLLGILQAQGYLQDALVVVTGDHGEMLGEHGQFAHGATVRQPALDIPWLMMRLGYVGKPLKPVSMPSQIDIAPTILSELGLPVPSRWSGRSLHDPARRSFVLFQQNLELGLIDLRTPGKPLKYWRSGGSMMEHLYDLSSDPGERDNLIVRLTPEMRAAWTQQLDPATRALVAR